MREWIKDRTIQIVTAVALIIIALPNLIAIKYAIYTPNDFSIACRDNLAGNGLSIIFTKFVNPMTGLNYSMLRMMLLGLFIFFILSFFICVYMMLRNFECSVKESFVGSGLAVGTFLFFNEYYEMFFWWTGAVFYELPIALLLCCISLYWFGKKNNLKALRIAALVGVAIMILSNCNPGTIDYLKNNYDEDTSFLKSIYYTICVVESECKNYLKNTGVLLGLGCVFVYGLKSGDISINKDTIKKRLWWIAFPFVSIMPLVYQRNIYNLERLPNRGQALIDMFLVVYLYMLAFVVGVYIKDQVEKPSRTYMRTVYIFLFLCAVVFSVNLKNSSDVRISKNIVTKQLQDYSDTWASIYYVCSTTDESDLVIETSVVDRVEGCCYPKLRSGTSSDKNQIVAKFFGLNTLSLKNTYED